MARHTGAVCKQCRRENTKLFLKGDRCITDKCALEKKPFIPGEHGRKRSKGSEYSFQLREKQKTKRIYGVLEKQFRNYYKQAAKGKDVTGEALLRLLETRLDNVVWRLGFTASRNEARQFVRHGHFEVNGRTASIPSFRVRAGDIVSVREKSKNVGRLKECAESASKAETPAWLKADTKNLKGEVLKLPLREEIDVPVQEELIVGLYSK
jgi:small subunit ribosomal protein S4